MGLPPHLGRLRETRFNCVLQYMTLTPFWLPPTIPRYSQEIFGIRFWNVTNSQPFFRLWASIFKKSLRQNILVRFTLNDFVFKTKVFVWKTQLLTSYIFISSKLMALCKLLWWYEFFVIFSSNKKQFKKF